PAMVPGVTPSKPSNPGPFVNVNGVLYFAADDGVHGRELWKTDGTAPGTVLVKDIYPGSDSNGNGLWSNPSNLTSVNGNLYFVAYDGVHGTELWKSDGTPGGTTIVADLHSGNTGSPPAF